MMVRFAAICDHCRSIAGGSLISYQNYLHCRDCGDQVCEACCVEYDCDPPGRALCKECQSTKEVV